MSIEENKALAQRHFEEVWNHGHAELLNDTHYAADWNDGSPNGLQAHQEKLLWWKKVAPGFHFTLLDVVAEGDTVMVHWQVDVTYSVVPDPPPTTPMPPLGTPVQWRGVDVMHFENGRLKSSQSVTHWVDILVEAGVYTLAKPEPA